MASAAPRVGVVIRTRNRPDFLVRAIRDVLGQSYRQWSVVIANDQGDRSAVDRVVASFASELEDRVTVVDVELPNGRSAAANQGIRAAGTEFVVLHDDDDWWDAAFLDTAVDWLDSHPDDAGVMVPTEIVYEEKKGDTYVETGRAPFWAGLSRIALVDLLQVNRAVPISFLYRRSLHDTVGFYDETLDAVEDWDLYLRITTAHHIGFRVGEPLAFWSQRPADRGDAGNSMYALGDVHHRSDSIVRERAMREYVRQHGTGVPLYIASLQASAAEDLDRRFADLHAHLDRLDRNSLAGLLGRVKRRLRLGGRA